METETNRSGDISWAGTLVTNLFFTNTFVSVFLRIKTLGLALAGWMNEEYFVKAVENFVIRMEPSKLIIIRQSHYSCQSLCGSIC